MWIISHQVLWIPTMCSSYTHTVHIRQKIESIWLSFQVPLKLGEVSSCLSKIISVFGKRFLTNVSFFRYCLFLFQFLFFFCFIFCLGLTWFFFTLVIFSWPCCAFLLQGELRMIWFFLSKFVRLSNLRTFR